MLISGPLFVILCILSHFPFVASVAATDEETLGLPIHSNSIAVLKPKLISLCHTYGIEYVCLEVC